MLFIIYNRTSYDHAEGVTFFFPDLRSSYYDGDNNDFANGTIWNISNTDYSENLITKGAIGWGNLLVQIFEEVDPDGPDNPIEPEPLPKLIFYEIYLPILNK